jgi:putative GTP pyrophosphokinase
MAKEISKTQIDRLGDRIKRGQITEEDLRLLDRHRRTFTAAYEVVAGVVRDNLGLEPTGRPAKSTISIIDKLKRESIRLTQIQDIAGCRLVVADIEEQESVVRSLRDLFEQATIVDRREKPSHGYRAVHVVVNYGGKSIEVQVRTSLQQAWAELSEKLSDVEEPSVKYGGGSEKTQRFLRDASTLISMEEFGEKRLMDELSSPTSGEWLKGVSMEDAREALRLRRVTIYTIIRDFIDHLSTLKERQL